MKNKLYNREWLTQNYIINNRTQKEIAIELNTSETTVCKYVVRYNLNKKGKYIKLNKGCFKNKHKPWNKGIPCSDKTKEKIRKANIGKKTPLKIRKKMGKKGKHHWNWKGGKTSFSKRVRKLLKWKLWRKAVYERDDYTCQECGGTNCELNPLFLKLVSQINFEILTNRPKIKILFLLEIIL